MGWILRILAFFIMVIAFGLGAWPVSLIALVYLGLTVRKPKLHQARSVKQDAFMKPKSPWGRLLLGCTFLILAAVALGSGGTFSPLVFLLGGVTVFLSPLILKGGFAGGVVPVRESILLRSKFVPLRWHALAEVKLESQDQSRGVAALDGDLLLFVGRSPSAFLVVSVYAICYRQAEEKVIRKLQRESRMISQRGAHLLPLDSADASQKLSLTLSRLNIGVEDSVSSLPFDVLALQTKKGMVVSHRAFRIADPSGSASIPRPDLSAVRRPLFAELVEKVSEKHGWPPPDGFSPFLAAMDASRAEHFVDKVRTKGESAGRVAVETPGGSEVRLSRAQLRAVARVYA